MRRKQKCLTLMKRKKPSHHSTSPPFREEKNPTFLIRNLNIFSISQMQKIVLHVLFLLHNVYHFLCCQNPNPKNTLTNYCYTPAQNLGERERERETTICPISHSLQQIRQFYTIINEIILCSLLKLQIHRVHFIVSFPNQLALLIQIFHYQKCFVKVKVNYTKCLHISILKTKNKKIFYLYHIFKYCL